MPTFSNKIIAITGAASGIGLATAKHIASLGAAGLALCDVQTEALNKAVAELKSSSCDVVGTTVDVSSNKEVDDWIEATVKHFGRLDGAANIAGVEGKSGVFTNFVDVKNEEWDYIIGINLTGLMYCLRAELRVMTQGAAIVNAASIAGLMGRPGIGPYSVSKHGVVGMTRTAAKEVGERGIRVNAVAPGPVETPMLSRLLKDAGGADRPVTNTYSSLPLRRLGQAEELAKVFAFLLSDDSSYTTGAVYTMDGGASC